MDNLDKTRRRIKLSMFGLLAVENILIIATFFILSRISHLHVLENILISFLASMLLAAIVTIGFADYVIGPLKAIWQLILHLSPTDHGISAPVTTQLQLGRELVAALSNQVYQMVSVADKTNEENQRTAQDLHNNFIARTLPLPLIVIDADQNIRFTNEAAAIYIGIASEDLIGKNVYMVMDMSFPSEDTFDSWLKSIKESSTTGNKTWERVRMDVRDTHPLRLFDLAAYYNHSNPQNNETVMVMFDHTEMYSQDEQAISFIALGVHELRTPLTLLRGYIEVFEDELGESLTVEQKSFMLKMHSQAEQLTIFVDNMLNVARIDDDQMELNLKSEVTSS
jgi:signal transduction histidine kinase